MGIRTCSMVSRSRTVTQILKLWPLVGLACIVLMLGLFPFGVSPEGRSDAFSWYKIGSLYFQPSEIVKIAFIFVGAATLEKLQSSTSQLKYLAFSLGCVGALFLMRDFGP